MSKGKCTHIVLRARDLNSTRKFYVDILRCKERRFDDSEGFLSILMGDFIINFYVFKDKMKIPPSYSMGIAHIGFELETRDEVLCFFKILKGSPYRVDRDEKKLSESYKTGPFRFYVQDPDGYTIEIHSWEGVSE